MSLWDDLPRFRIPPACVLPVLGAAASASGTVRILSGRFGTVGKFLHAGPELELVCDGKAGCEAPAYGSWCGYPNPGVAKELEVRYSCGSAANVLRTREGDGIHIRC